MRRLAVYSLMLIVALIGLACAPAAAPAPSPAPAVPQAAPAAPQLTPEEAAWQGVVKAAQKEGRIVVYDYGIFTGDVGRAVTKAFKEKYGITVEFLVTGGSSVTIEKLGVEKKMGQAVADMTTHGSVSGPRVIGLGFMQPVVHALPALRDEKAFKIEMSYAPGGEMLNMYMTRVGLGFNPNLVKREEVQSQYDLLNPKWKGKIIMRDPRLGSGGAPVSIVAYRAAKLLDDDFFYKLGAHEPVLSAMGYHEIGLAVARGEYAIYWAAGDLTLAPLVKEGAPIVMWDYKEGPIAQTSGVFLLKDAVHPNAVKLFMNWLASPEGHTVFIRAGGYASLRHDVPDGLPEALARVKFSKITAFNWDMTLQSHKEIQEKLYEKFFGKR